MADRQAAVSESKESAERDRAGWVGAIANPSAAADLLA
jgi:hypothetical protein